MDQSGDKVVVIGAGMGGLAAAVRLALAGKTVSLFETATGPGGKMRVVQSDAGPIDAGPTVLTLRRVFDDLFALAGERLEDHLTLLAQPILARHWWPDGSRLDLCSDLQSNIAAIRDFAGPREAAGFARFHAATAALYAAFEKPVMLAPRPDVPAILRAAAASPRLWPTLLPGISLQKFVALYFRDPRLIQLFSRYATYVGGRPDRAPAVLALIWQAEAQGVWAVKGGMHNLAQALADLATRHGVTLHFGTDVSGISRQGGRVCGVHLADGRRIACDSVVFNGDPAALSANLLGDGVQSALPQNATAPRSLSAQVWSFASELGGPLAADLCHHNLFFASDPALEFGPIGKGQLPVEPTIYLCAQDRAGKTVPLAKERIEIVLNAPALTRHTATDPEEAFHCRTKTLDLLQRRGLHILQAPDPSALTTPRDLARLYPGSMGAIYGRSPEGVMASFQRPTARTALPGLYLAGGGCHPGAGVPMAALSGKHAAEAILTDQTSGSRLAQTATRGGMSMASRMMGRGPFRS